MCCFGWEIDPYYYRRLAEKINNSLIAFPLHTLIEIEGNPTYIKNINSIMRVREYSYLIHSKYSWERIVVFTSLNYPDNIEVIVYAIPM